MAAANIYTTLLIGWGDTGSIIAVLAAVSMLGLVSSRKPSVHVLNLGQTLVSAGGSIGFAVASYAAVHIVDPEFAPSKPTLIAMFACMGLLGAIIGSSVRRYMVKYFFPSGTACAVIQTSVARHLEPGERNRPVWMLMVWGSVAALVTIPTKITLAAKEHALVSDLKFGLEGFFGRYAAGTRPSHELGVAVDPLLYGIGIVVGPRIGIGMLIGALAAPFLIQDVLAGSSLEAETGDWIKWLAIAVLTLPTFATILFAYFFRTPAVVPPGFEPGRTEYHVPPARPLVYGMLGVLAALGIAFTSQAVFGLPWLVTAVTILVAWPLCVMNGRVTGDTDINPVRLVAIVLLSAFFWMIAEEARGPIVMLGMAVVGGTLASVAVDMMQDYRTGYLVDANPTHQTSVQFVGVVIGALVSVPVLGMLLNQLGGIGEGTSLPAPGAKIWAAMAEAAGGGFVPSSALVWGIVLTSILGSLYAYLTVWPVTAKWMPSIFGIGIGMLLGVPMSAAIFIGGLLKGATTLIYTSGKAGEERAHAASEAGNDTMLAGASVFAAGAVLSIVLVLLTSLLAAFGLHPFYIAGGH
jgi:uncharacterized oligopeptide transporter (OPT) family protein